MDKQDVKAVIEELEKVGVQISNEQKEKVHSVLSEYVSVEGFTVEDIFEISNDMLTDEEDELSKDEALEVLQWMDKNYSGSRSPEDSVVMAMEKVMKKRKSAKGS